MGNASPVKLIACFTVSLFLFCAQAQSPSEATLQITVGGSRDAKGVVKLILYRDEAVFKEADAAIDAKTLNAVFLIPHLPSGNYSAYVYHDRNGNGKLDTNLFGIPTEEYGASNNPPKRAGRPGFNETRFMVDAKDLAIGIQMISW